VILNASMRRLFLGVALPRVVEALCRHKAVLSPHTNSAYTQGVFPSDGLLLPNL
jgi:hypothetical protein